MSKCLLILDLAQISQIFQYYFFLFNRKNKPHASFLAAQMTQSKLLDGTYQFSPEDWLTESQIRSLMARFCRRRKDAS